MRRIGFVRLAAAGLLLLLSAPSGHAQDYPDKPIRVVLTYTAGGVSDGIMRLLAPKMEEMLGQKLIIEAKPGAAGNIGTIEVAKSPPDGYTLVVTATNNFVINQYTMKMPIDPLTALAPVAKLADVPLVLFSNPTIPAKDFAAFIDYVKANPAKVNFGSPAAGTVNHMLLERVKQTKGLDMQHIPFRGSPQGVMALLQNDIQLFTVGYAAGIGHLKDGKLTALAVASDERLPELPDTPTLAESGLPGFTGANWWGMAAPAGTPEPVVRKIREAVQAALKEPNVIARYKALGLGIPKQSPEQWAAGLRAEAELWSDTVKRGGIVLQ
ncbi:tripartite tricarboxylate transporter substrate binding protein [Pseudorhodoplanes sp.]|uniref:Bug family tripartite tricarboxylate transporter substrate binding protein n=1 Tax=Pseudorhodoplanes sp. TaxID=1934341 RepID=UPI002C057A92|nr:tripartite tricarboxylate transporter substrate binding protein [Pseudorhodoplanes sp.]HWV43785.1 tripartite tricarboxylate transporter substrate binding protein [Pseudorhodoplanes sp.]